MESSGNQEMEDRKEIGASILKNTHPVIVELRAVIQNMHVLPTCDELDEMIRSHPYWREHNFSSTEKAQFCKNIKFELFQFIHGKILFVNLEDERAFFERAKVLTNNFTIIDACRDENHQKSSCGAAYHYRSVRDALRSHWQWKVSSIVEDIYQKNRGCLTWQELDNVVPEYPNAPHYIRDEVILKYLEKMRMLKYRGEQFDTDIAILRSGVEAEEELRTSILDEYIKH